MAKYRIISPKIWNDAKFKALSDNAKLVFFMLLTHPHTTAIGTLRAYLQGLTAELNWTEEAFSKAFQEAFQKGMVKVDERAGLIWLPNFIKYNQPQSPNVIKSWAGALDDCPECELKNQIFSSIKSLSRSLSKAFSKAFDEAFQKGMPNQEQDPEQDQEQESPPNPPEGKRDRKNNFEFGSNPVEAEFLRLRDCYNQYARQEAPNTGWKEFQKLKWDASYPGIDSLCYDIMERSEKNFWDKGYEVSLVRYINERVWLQKIKPKLSEDEIRKQKTREALLKIQQEDEDDAN